jgi:hypothetical protein
MGAGFAQLLRFARVGSHEERRSLSRLAATAE